MITPPPTSTLFPYTTLFRSALEKLTELGVARIVPLIAERSSQHLVSAAEKRVERWRKIAREASQQARRIAPPDIPDRKSTRLNSSHPSISYAVFCLKKKKKI